jgi:uncharacterized protein (DUF433 family)
MGRGWIEGQKRGRGSIDIAMSIEHGVWAMALDRITSNPARMNGQPCIRNLRLTVRRVVELVALYPDRKELRREYPELEEEDIKQALAYAAASLDDRGKEPP